MILSNTFQMVCCISKKKEKYKMLQLIVEKKSMFLILNSCKWKNDSGPTESKNKQKMKGEKQYKKLINDDNDPGV